MIRTVRLPRSCCTPHSPRNLIPVNRKLASADVTRNAMRLNSVHCNRYLHVGSVHTTDGSSGLDINGDLGVGSIMQIDTREKLNSGSFKVL